MKDETREYQRLNPEDILTGSGGRKYLEQESNYYIRWHTGKMDEKVEKDNEEYLKRKHGKDDN